MLSLISFPPLTPWQRLWRMLIAALLILCFGIYTIAYLFIQPYSGFMLDDDSKVIAVYNNSTSLKVGDILLKIEKIASASSNPRAEQPFDIQAGDLVKFLIRRNGLEETVIYQYPVLKIDSFFFRLVVGQWWVVSFFLAAALLTIRMGVPQDTNNKVLGAFFSITAVFLVASSTSWGSIADRMLTEKAIVWIMIPVYFHLHWIFPKPLKKLPALLWFISYMAGIALALLERTIYPILSNFHVLAIILCFVPPLILLVVHWIVQKDHKREVVLAFFTFLIPSLTLILKHLAFDTPAIVGALGIFGLALIPLLYSYIVYHSHPSYFEMHLNKVISTGFFTLAVLVILAIIGEILKNLLSNVTLENKTIFFLLINSIISIGLTAIFLEPFQELIEKYILKIPVPPKKVLATYYQLATQVTRFDELSTLLTKDITPSLSIEQSALVLLENKKVVVVYADKVEANELPQDENIGDVLKQLNVYRPIEIDKKMCCSWARLILPLNINGEVIGLWILGKRRTDDIYFPNEIETLQTLSNATAITIGHITQAEKLRLLYQENINKVEAYRAEIAYEIHDRTLNDLANLKSRFAEIAPPDVLFEEWDRITQELRQTVNDLRPSLLNYNGVYGAVCELIDNLEEKHEDKITFINKIESDSSRYLPRTEEHLYRIIQQIVKNAVKHSKLKTLVLRGQLNAEGADLVIEDDGIGFEVSEQPDLIALVSKRRFGLANIYERANPIKATLKFNSAPNGKGTRVYLKWKNAL